MVGYLGFYFWQVVGDEGVVVGIDQVWFCDVDFGFVDCDEYGVIIFFCDIFNVCICIVIVVWYWFQNCVFV